MRIALALSVWAVWACMAGPASARQDESGAAEKKAASAEPSGGPKLGEPQVHRWRIGMIVTAVGGPCGRMTGATSVPMDWPEQQVKIVAQNLSPGVTISYKMFKKTARQMVVSFPAVAGGQEVRAVVTFELTRRAIGPPESPDAYVVPDAKKLPGELKDYLDPSPTIESGHPRIKALAEQTGADRPNAWDKAKAYCECIRQKIQYQKDARLTGVIEALDKGTGDCNQLTSGFIALCRAGGIPARTVRIPGHCYPEFYLEDGQGQGHWFACEASGDEAFGGVRGYKPILQKGDNFRSSAPDPAKRGARIEKFDRFLPETLTGTPKRGGGQPQMKLVCEAATE
jgi:hypothetical protein